MATRLAVLCPCPQRPQKRTEVTSPEGSHFPYDLPLTSNCGSERVSVCTLADVFVRVGNGGCAHCVS